MLLHTEDFSSPASMNIHNTPYRRTNELPPESVLLVAKNTLLIHQACLRDKEKVLNTLQVILNAVQSDIDSITREITECNQLMAPIRRLPDELLTEIFFGCMPTNRNPRTLTSEAPLLLTLVCRKWREIALSLPELWSKIHIVYLDYVDTRKRGLKKRKTPITLEDFPQRVFGIEQWLIRSASRPLSLSIFCSSMSSLISADIWQNFGYVPKEYDRFAESLSSILAQYASRWVSLEFIGPCELLDKIVSTARSLYESRPEQGAFPLIRKIRTRMPLQQQWDPYRAQSMKTLFGSPSLRQVSIQNIDRPFLVFNWRSLTHISIHEQIHRRIALNILRACSSEILQACALNIVTTPLGTEYIPGPFQYPNHLMKVESAQQEILLPRLTSLLIQGEIGDEGNICGLLYTPTIKNFLYYPADFQTLVPMYSAMRDGWDNWSELPLSNPTARETDISRPLTCPLCTFLLRSSSLETLTLSPSNIIGTDMLAIFQCTPQITSLVLNRLGCDEFPGDIPPATESPYKLNLLPLLEQRLVSADTGSSTIIAEQLVPNLKSFTALGVAFEDTDSVGQYAKFINDRIHPLRGMSSGSTAITTSLRRVKMTLKDYPVKIETLIKEHAEKVGRRVGNDLILDINYPWNGDQEPSKDDKLRFTQEGLHIVEDVTWPYIEIA